ncbi:MAG: rod shape-determining protein RodA [Bacteroidales bacterium]|nr:rod shape-determining protein RodA [Bacteroidales bacterium]
MVGYRNRNLRFDWYLVICYLLLVFIGWINIYAAMYSDTHTSIFDLSQKCGMQFIWMLISFGGAILVMFIINEKTYSVLSTIIYILVCALLFAVIFLGREVSGSKSWFELGPVRFQPAEISKISTSLLLAYTMSKYGFKLTRLKDALKIAAIILIPMLLIVMEKETGSALVYCGFIFVLYREGLSGWILLFGILSIILFILTLIFSPLVAITALLGIYAIIYGLYTNQLFKSVLTGTLTITALAFLPSIGELETFAPVEEDTIYYIAAIISCFIAIFAVTRIWNKRFKHLKLLLISFFCSIALIFSVDFIFEKVMQPHQRARIENLLGITEDLKGIGYNVHQSKIAIGSGGFTGKGFLEGTQTKFDFVPEQSTDFIFCTIGEEWGFIGSVFLICIYLLLIIRLVILSERQKDKFTYIYGYCVACCIFMHVFINLGMTMGLLPVIGIPLPYVSYGGSSLLTFTILLFIFIRLDMERWK